MPRNLKFPLRIPKERLQSGLSAAPGVPLFALNSDTWGNGYGTETVRLLLACAFEDLDLHRVWGARSPLNTASARTMERAGFTEEGYIREHVQRGGQWSDSVTLSIPRPELARRREVTTGAGCARSSRSARNARSLYRAEWDGPRPCCARPGDAPELCSWTWPPGRFTLPASRGTGVRDSGGWGRRAAVGGTRAGTGQRTQWHRRG